jgi:hypothetical protein
VPALPARAEASQTVDLVLARRRPLVSSSGARPLHRRGRARVGAARSRCRAAAALLPEAKQQPRPSDPVLAHLRADEWGASGAANTSRAAGGAWEQQSGVATPGRCNLESRRAPARHGTRGSPRTQESRPTRRDGCLAREMRKPNRATRTAAGALLLFWDLRLLVRHGSSHQQGAERIRDPVRGDTIAALAGARRPKRSCQRSSATMAIPGVARPGGLDVAASRCRQSDHGALGRRRGSPYPNGRAEPVKPGETLRVRN